MMCKPSDLQTKEALHLATFAQVQEVNIQLVLLTFE